MKIYKLKLDNELPPLIALDHHLSLRGKVVGFFVSNMLGRYS